MAKISDVEIPSLLYDEQGSDPTTPASTLWRLYFKATGLFHRDDAGTVSGPMLDETAHDALDHTGLTGVGGGGADGYTLISHVVTPPTGTASTATPGADDAFAWPITIPSPMLLQGLAVEVSSAGTGTHEWGLFDFSANPAAATKLAGGSGQLTPAGAPIIAATGAPVSVNPGGYMIVLKFPAANRATIRRTLWTGTVAHGTMKFATSYAWDDTPNFTSGWTADSVVIHVHLVGRLDASNQW